MIPPEFVRILQALFLALIFGVPMGLMWAMMFRVALLPPKAISGVATIVPMLFIVAAVLLATNDPATFDAMWAFLWTEQNHKGL